MRLGRRLDLARVRELERRLAAGENEFEAWGEMLRADAFGYLDTRGKRELDARRVARSLVAFLERVEPLGMQASVRALRLRLRATARVAATQVQRLVDGAFDDPAAAAVTLRASELALKVAGVIESGPRATTQVNTQVNVGLAGALRAEADSGH
jgi:hypothetical protein